MNRTKHYIFTLLCLFAVLLHIQLTISHPQCLDFKPPFKAERNLSFCSQYSDFGCCTGTNDNGLTEEYRQIRNTIPSSLWIKCNKYIKELLCQKCSPYAAHIYSAEGTFVASPLPGLCPTYCSSFYQKCKDVIPYLTRDSASLQAASLGESQFCKFVNISDIDYCYPELLNNDVLNNKISQVTVNSEGCLCVKEFANGLYNPVFARHAGDGSQRLFVGEVTGLVHIYYINGTKEPEPFLDFKNNFKVLNTQNEGDERGFLGMAFHPDFKQNQKFYIYYSTHHTDPMAQGDHKIRISQMTVSQFNKNMADIYSEKIILEVTEPYWNHNGGEILFGDDGYLYIFVGDGGAGGDPHSYAQNLSNHLGKILRIDVNVDFDSQLYKIPIDNPFRNLSYAQPEIYAYGVRNIWRCGKDRGDPVTGDGKGRIICGDVGQNKYEEIDIVKKGVNYGWNTREGFGCFNELCGLIGPEELPIHSYSHAVGKSVTGGHIYRGCQSPNLNGFYFYGDYMNGKLFRLIENKTTGKWDSKQLYMCKSDTCVAPLQSNYEPHIMSFGEDEDGEVYLISTGRPSSGSPLGYVYRIVDPSRRGNPANCRSARDPVYDSKRVETGQPAQTTTTASSSTNSRTNPPGATFNPPSAGKSRRRGDQSRRRGRFSLRIEGVRLRLCRNRRKNMLCNLVWFGF